MYSYVHCMLYAKDLLEICLVTVKNHVPQFVRAFVRPLGEM